MQKRTLYRWRYGIALAAIIAIMAGRYLYFMPCLASGATSPDFSADLPSGEPFRLSDLHDRYVLIHFWGSWCGPCRAENPQLVELYSRHGGADFAIVSVGIEKDSARWGRARAQDGLLWPYHFIEITPSLRFFNSPIANQFGVKKLPMLFLLRPGGEVVLADPEIEDVEKLLRKAER